MSAHTVSLKGVRNENEDKHSVILNLDKRNAKHSPVNFFGVYDGHGGKFVSKFLEKNLSNFFVDHRVQYPLSKKYVNAVFDYLQNTLRDKYNERALHCGSTCVNAIHYKKNENDYLSVFNAGDSRCIMCRDNMAISLTKDHKPHWPEERNRIEQLGGQVKWDGADWRIKDLSVSRSFGDLDSEPFLTARPDVYKYKLEGGDKFIVLACDGLFDVMENQDVVNFILGEMYDPTTKQKKINTNINVAKRLAEHAIQKGSGDNVSIVVYFLDNHDVLTNKDSKDKKIKDIKP